MAGINAVSGTILTEIEDIRQSIAKILTTPIGTRVMRRDFGSNLFDLIDSPASPTGGIQVVAAAAHAVAIWEKRVDMQSASLTAGLDGKAILRTVCQVKASGLTITADVPLSGAS